MSPRAARHASSAPFFTPTPLTRVLALLVATTIGVGILSIFGWPHSTGRARVPVAQSRAAATRPAADARRAPRISRALGAAVGSARTKPTAGHRATATRRPATGTHRPGRWLPSGTGVWIYQWSHTAGGRARSVVARARRVGLTTLYLRTGSSHDGFTGRTALRSLLGAAHGTALRVVAWDFPELWRPRRDARRLAYAARLRAAHGAHVSAVAPDIETPAEGTFNSASRVRLYLTTLRRLLPRSVTILTAVPWPSRYRVGNYPFRTVAAHSDALVPMTYWYNNSPVHVTARSISYLRRFHKPVQPVGQGYDGKLDVPSLPHNNLGRQVPAFFRTARNAGVKAVSIWSWQAAPLATWRALAHAHRLFPSRR